MSRHNKRNSILSTFGFSLVEIMVTLGIAGAGALGFMQLQKSNVSGQKKTQVKYDASNLANSIGNLLLSEKNCAATFSSIALSTSSDEAVYSTPKSFTNIKVIDASGSQKVLYKTGDLIGSLEIKGFEYMQDAPLLASSGMSMYGTVNVSVVYQNVSKVVMTCLW